ncbi:hypothetical protein ASPVEDRAFT_33317 [Aspergillus versicolor CBS 583.65]|uniref:Uncharacterized protein n=1 Tax=Aspergillus versicolor CBS 583.65 TaxID=1036611 RepID=A0A1L9PZX7_ASPVE|nr:uncharacterized protein ASPVEDRAFT_33317 [Aspergillus versicolor CBS 583.65]OJJ07073.1 hypothetical protein ASPVEDRAFT_33317 [Aspergillus versicolor CBS 583.65]
MDQKGPKGRDNRDGDDNDDGKSSTPETPEEVQRRIAGLSISQETHNTNDSTSSRSDHSNKPQEDKYEQGQRQARVDDELGTEDESSRTFRINTLRGDADEQDNDEEQEETRKIEPDELKNILFSFETPREVDLRVKISGDLNVTILYVPCLKVFLHGSGLTREQGVNTLRGALMFESSIRGVFGHYLC